MGTKTLVFSLMLALAAAVSGCSGKYANQSAVNGEVTLDGKPIEQGSIVFAPIRDTRGTVVGGRISNGHYRLSDANGPAVGWNRAEIRCSRKTGRRIPKGLGGTGETVEELVEAVPAKFNSTSTLTIEIKPGDNVGNFEVTTK